MRGRFASARLDARRADDLAPFLGFVDDELAELDGSHRHWNVAQGGKLRLHLGIGKACVNFFVEFVDDVGRRALWRTHAVPSADIVAWDRLTYGRNIR